MRRPRIERATFSSALHAPSIAAELKAPRVRSLSQNPVVLVDPVAVDISHCFFLGAVGVEVRSSGTKYAFVSGLQV